MNQDAPMRMRILSWLIVPVLVGLASYFAATGQARRAWRKIVKRGPLIEYPARLDLGQHEMGDQAIAHFTIANRGGGELVVDEIQSNCSCTGMEREQGGRYGRITSLRLKKGEEVNLVMRISVRGVPIGADMVNAVDFRTNDPTHPTGRIEAIVRCVSGGVSVSPRSIVLGTVPIGAKLRYVVDVHDNALTPRIVERVASTKPDRITARILSTSEGASSPESDRTRVVIGRIEIIVKTESAGEVDETVQLHLAGEARKPDKISIIGKIVAPIEINPSLLILPRASAKGPVFDGMCICRSMDGQPLSMIVESAPPGLSVAVLDEGKATRRIQIKWNPKSGAEPASGQRSALRLRAKAGEHEALLELKLLLRG